MQLVREAGLDLRPHGKIPLGYEPVEDPNMRKVPKFNEVIPPDVTYTGGKFTIKMGDRRIELRHFGPSDGRCMSVFYMPKEKVIQAVDIHLYGMLVSLDHLYSHEYIGVLNTLRRIRGELNYDFVVNGHVPGSSPHLFDKDLNFGCNCHFS